MSNNLEFDAQLAKLIPFFGEPTARDARLPSRFHLERNADGNHDRCEYLDDRERPCLRNGVAGWNVLYSGSLPVMLSFFDLNGNLRICNDGYCTVLFLRSELDVIDRVCFYDEDDAVCWTRFGFSQYTYSVSGDECRYAFLDDKGEPCAIEGHYHSLRARYDSRGNRVAESYFGVNGMPCLNTDGVSKIEREFADDGTLLCERYLGVNGLPCIPHDRVSLRRLESVEGSSLRQFVAYDLFGERIPPAAVKDDALAHGYSRESRFYDDLGRLVKIGYLDAALNPCVREEGGLYSSADEKTLCVNHGGFSVGTFSWDDRGYLAEECYYKPDGHFVECEYPGARVKYERDVYGNALSETHYDARGNVLLRYQREYDERNRIVKSRTSRPQSDDGQSFPPPVVQYRYEKNGSIREWFTDDDGNPCQGCMVYAARESFRDTSGRELSRMHYGIDGAPVVVGDAAGWSIEYDEYGRRIKTTLLGIDGNPCSGREQFATEEIIWDATYGTIAGKRFFDVDGKPCESRTKYGTSGIGWDISRDAEHGKWMKAFLLPDGSVSERHDCFSPPSGAFREDAPFD